MEEIRIDGNEKMKNNYVGLDKVKEELLRQKVDGVLVCSAVNISYLTGYSNFSIEEREAYMVVTKKRQVIITDSRYSEAIEQRGMPFELFVRSPENPTKRLFEELIEKDQVGVLGIEEDNLTVGEYKALRKVFKKMRHFDLSGVRAVKSLEEIKKIGRACQIGDLGFEYIKTQIKPGIKEVELAALLEDFIKEQGGKLSFETIAAFGKNSSIPHHQTGQDKLKDSPGQLIKLDFGVKFENYCSDMTRTVFWGKPTPKQVKIYETVKRAQEKAVEFIENHLKSTPRKPLKVSEVDLVAKKYIESQDLVPYSHSLGHGIGLEVHENPVLSYRSTQVLVEGNVFSIEPGVYIPGFGGVRIEDLYAISGGKLRGLTKASKELTILE